MSIKGSKLGLCPRCQLTSEQKLFEFTNLIYKCTKCGNIHG